MLTLRDRSYTVYSVNHTTPFFKCFGPLLFGRAPVSAAAEAFAKFSQASSFSHLRKAFDSYIPNKLFSQNAFGGKTRRRIFSLDVIFWSFLHQIQTPDGSCREAVRAVSAFLTRKLVSGKTAPSISQATSAYCQARNKLPLDMLDQINTHLVDQMQKHIPVGNLWHGRQVRLIDGTGVSMPDTALNQEKWPQSKSQTPGCGFPMMNVVGIFCLITGALVKAAYGDRHIHESKLFQSLWPHLQKGELVVTDRGFCSFGAFAALKALGVDSLMRLPEKKIRKAIGAHLPKAPQFDVLVNWKRPAKRTPKMTAQEFALLPESIDIRVVRYSIVHKGFRTQSVTLVTTLTDAGIPAEDLATLYGRRWGVELHFREIKTQLKMDVLRCHSPHMIERELRMHFIAYNLVRSVMQKSALTYNVNLERVSFKGCLDTVRQFAHAISGLESKPKSIAAMIDKMLQSIAKDLTPLRPGRSEPRVKKRRPKNYRLMTKPRKEMGNLPHRKVGVEKHPKKVLT